VRGTQEREAQMWLEQASAFNTALPRLRQDLRTITSSHFSHTSTHIHADTHPPLVQVLYTHTCSCSLTHRHAPYTHIHADSQADSNAHTLQNTQRHMHAHVHACAHSHTLLNTDIHTHMHTTHTGPGARRAWCSDIERIPNFRR